jgi:glyceraldehyde 3-phosphate dehydrogenase
MKQLRLAINGFGRIGRHALKATRAYPNMTIVAINDLTDTKTLAHLLKHDTVYGPFEGMVEAKEGNYTP